MGLAAALSLGWPRGLQSQSPGAMQTVESSVRYHYPRRVAAKDVIGKCVVELVMPIEHDPGFDRAACARTSDGIGKLEEPWLNNASRRPRHVHIVQPCTNYQSS